MMRRRGFTKAQGAVTVMSVLVCLFMLTDRIPAEGERRISMDFQKAALKDVLKVFSQQAGLNFIATQNIESKQVTLYLDGVTVDDALNSIMKANNLTYEQAPGSSVFLVKEETAPPVIMTTKVYALQYAKVKGDVKGVLEKVIEKEKGRQSYGEIVIDERTNNIVITAIPEVFPLAEEVIKKLDVESPQALIEAEIVEIESNAFKVLGLEWGGSGGTFVSFTGPQRSTKFPFIRKVGGPFNEILGSGMTRTFTAGTLNLSQFQLVIKALETEGKAHYLAKPRIMVLNNAEAEMKITANAFIGVKTTTISESGDVITEAERQETGISLKVTPTINDDNYITMTVEPTVSRVAQSFNSSFYDPSERSAKTTVMVKDGQTIAIGGLLKTSDEDADRFTPGVSKIPFIGNLFKRQQKTGTGTEIIIFVTTHVIRSLNDLTPEEVKLAQTSDAGVNPAQLLPPAEGEYADTREAEIEKTVTKLRKKRELSSQR